MEGKQEAIGTDITAALVKNIEKIDPKALIDDDSLLSELVSWRSGQHMGSQPLGVVLISKETKCVTCGSQLPLRKDRPTCITVYDTNIGPMQGTHYHKNCSKCSLTQYYRYHTTGGESKFTSDL